MDEIIKFYTQTEVETNRLFEDVTQLERVRSQELILRHLPAAPATILDIGGGMGFYAFWLAEQGHEVHLLDIVPLHIETVTKRNAEVPRKLSSVSLGDARGIDQPSDAFDVALLMGPLYHLVDRESRLQALREARRVLRPGGTLLAVNISKFASLLGGFTWGDVDNPEFVTIMKGDLSTSKHLNATGDHSFFTTSYFQHPDELCEEVGESGFQVEKLYAIESFGRYIPDFEKRWEDHKARAFLLDMIRAVESEPSLMGLTCHNMAVARKP